MKKKKGIVRKVVDKLYRGILIGTAAAIVFDAPLQIKYHMNDAKHQQSPSTVRIEFEREFGYPLKGYVEDIENNKRRISHFAETIHQENYSMSCKLDSIRIRSDSFLKKDIYDQFDTIVSVGNAGNCANDYITLHPSYGNTDTLCHEIKHAKTFAIIKQHPELLTRWKALSTDNDGKSLYLSSIEGECKRLRFLNKLVKEKKEDQVNNRDIGFITDYARTNVYEDIAELCETAETDLEHIHREIFEPGTKTLNNSLIKRKADLAIEYRLVPQELLEAAYLSRLKIGIMCYEEGVDKEMQEKYTKESDTFIDNHPNSIYIGEILLNRATYLKFARTSYKDTAEAKKIENAYMRVLDAPFKDRYSYNAALANLANLGGEILVKDTQRATIFLDALRLYTKRENEGEINLAKKGVNDFLILKGIVLPQIKGE